MTARQIIQRAFRILGITAASETPRADEMTHALEALNDMLETWMTQNFLRPNEIRLSFTTQAAKNEYTIGVDPLDDDIPHLDFPHVLEIFSGFVRYGDLNDVPIAVKAVETFNAVFEKSQQGRPYFLCYEPSIYNSTTGVQMPQTGRIRLYPTPNAESYEVFVQCLVGHVELTSLDETMPFNDHYKEAFVFNLAYDLMDEFGAQMSQDSRVKAMNLKTNLKRLNARPVPNAKYENNAWRRQYRRIIYGEGR